MSNLYQDAILDAKALRASAMANAKAALEEAFEPKIQEMIAKHLSEEEEMEEAKDHEMEEGYEKHEEGKMHDGEVSEDINEAELEEILNQLEEMSEPKEESLNEAEEEGEEEEKEEEGEEEGEEAAEGEEDVTDETKVIDITLGDLKQVIQSLMPGEAMPAAEEPTADSEAEEEVSLEEILDELEAEGAEDVNSTGYEHGHQVPQEEIEGLQEKKHKKGDEEEKEKMEENAINEADVDIATVAAGIAGVLASAGGITALQAYLKQKYPKAAAALEKLGSSSAQGTRMMGNNEAKDHAKELKEAKATIETLRKDLQEVNLLNAKYLYMNKLFKSKSLTESQKLKVVNALDRAVSVKEVKNTYETLKESFETKKGQLKESVGFASKPAGVAPKANIVEAEQFVSRWQKLAGIK